jgi:autocrine motility factor receptor
MADFSRGLSSQLIDMILFLNIRTHYTNLRARVTSYLHYRRATKNLREAFPNATVEQLVAFDDDCAICKERMTAAKRLPCGHLFHFSCLRSWLEQGASVRIPAQTYLFGVLCSYLLARIHGG